ncbi:sugar phosphate isomerase/epimerase, partial [bacterium]|nr:sugar phosphate isomerase/epimerase [bacterium]
MKEKKSFHSICRWTFHQGAGGFVPGYIRPEWKSDRFHTTDFVRLVKERIKPKLPDFVELGVEMHYDNEYNKESADEIADALISTGIHVAMLTPGAHLHWGYGGVASLDPNERAAAEEYGKHSVDLAYHPLKKAWHPDPEKAPTFVIWNGSFGYDLATVGIKRMYQNLKESIADLCHYEAKLGGKLFWGL